MKFSGILAVITTFVLFFSLSLNECHSQFETKICGAHIYMNEYVSMKRIILCVAFICAFDQRVFVHNTSEVGKKTIMIQLKLWQHEQCNQFDCLSTSFTFRL